MKLSEQQSSFKYYSKAFPLYSREPHWYDSTATEAKFLLGGIGTGNVSIGSRGQLCDWEIFNKPQKGGKLSFTFFALRTKAEEEEPKIRIMEAALNAPHERAQGYDAWESGGVPRFAKARMTGEISHAVAEISDDMMPVNVTLSAWSPFIPLNADDSGIPGTYISYTVKNVSDKKQEVSVAGSIANAVGFRGYGIFGALVTEGEPQNEYIEEDGLCILNMTNPSLPEEHLTNGSMALLLKADTNVSHKLCWNRSSWWNGAHDFFDDLKEDGKLQDAEAKNDYVPHPHFDAARLRIGALCSDFVLEPGEEKTVDFVLAWYFPNRPAQWKGHIFRDADSGEVVKNYYTNRFQNAKTVGKYLFEQKAVLQDETEKFTKAFYETDIPNIMIEAMAANMTVLRSSTCFRIQDGSFLTWEGCFDDKGCCEGNCTHVWNYEQTLPHLFPDLARDMRRTNFMKDTDEDGNMAYRSNTVIGYPRYDKLPPAADGQLGCVIQLYREWKFSGDNVFLKACWPGAKRALEYAIRNWDTDGDGVLDSEQNNTYDIAFFGKTALTNSIFYTALYAAAEIAEYLGETEQAERYLTLRKKGAVTMDQELYNGMYYEQVMTDDKEHLYQFGKGCLSDQVLGEQLAVMNGIPGSLPKEHVKKALLSIYEFNYKKELKEHLNVQRCYALNEEGGLLLCSWPKGERPNMPFIYSDEVWCGIEYQVASHLLAVGELEKALELVRSTRARYDGVKRNPWNEVECGNHYVRSMSSYGLLLAASGCQVDLTQNAISFSPRVKTDHFKCFFSTGKCWGIYRCEVDALNGEKKESIEVLYGENVLLHSEGK